MDFALLNGQVETFENLLSLKIYVQVLDFELRQSLYSWKLSQFWHFYQFGGIIAGSFRKVNIIDKYHKY